MTDLGVKRSVKATALKPAGPVGLRNLLKTELLNRAYENFSFMNFENPFLFEVAAGT